MPIARVALPVAAATAFDYWIPDGAPVRRGSVVRVALGPRRLVGVVHDVVAESDVPHDKLQTITDIADVPPLPDDVLALAAFVASYYQESPGQALALAVPPLSAARPRAPRRASAQVGATDRDGGAVEFNAEQEAAIEAIDAADGVGLVPFLLFGVAGSGKTDVHDFGSNYMVEEFLFVPKGTGVAEEDCWIIGTAINTTLQRTEVHVFDAGHVSDGPVAVWQAGYAWQLGFHGTWAGA